MNKAAKVWLIFFLSLTLFSLIQSWWQSGISFLLYATIGGYIISEKTIQYWKTIIIPQKICLVEIVTSICTFLFISSLFSLLEKPDIQNYSLMLTTQAIVFAPIFEELFFRNFLYLKLKNKFNLSIAIILSTVLFAAIHLKYSTFSPLNEIGVYLTSGLLLVLIRHFTNSIFYCILIHALVNMIIIIG